MAPFFPAYGLVRGAYIGTEALSTVVMDITKLGAFGQTDVLTLSGIVVGLAFGADHGLRLVVWEENCR